MAGRGGGGGAGDWGEGGFRQNRNGGAGQRGTKRTEPKQNEQKNKFRHAGGISSPLLPELHTGSVKSVLLCCSVCGC